MNKQRIFEALLRRDFFLFLQKVFATLHPAEPPLEHTPYLKALCHVMVLAFTGQIRRYAINIPPRHLKSITVAVAFPAFVLGQGTPQGGLGRQGQRHPYRICSEISEEGS